MITLGDVCFIIVAIIGIALEIREYRIARRLSDAYVAEQARLERQLREDEDEE